MRVLVTGARGFLGSGIATALIQAGHDVVAAVRASTMQTPSSVSRTIACDMARDVDEAVWLPRLEGIDAVVNCAGILREHVAETFEAIHLAAPLALFRACSRAGVRRVVQISALGDPADGEFVASKHRCDEALSKLPIDWIVLRPSVVYSTRGSYGGTSLLRALAALPWLFLPADGTQRLQPISLDDVAATVVAVLAKPEVTRETFELVGPNIVTLADYLRAWRRWLGYPRAREWRVPSWCVRIGATLGEWLGSGPLGLTMLRMLDRGNIGAPDAWQRLNVRLGVNARSLDDALAAEPAQTQDRWSARLYFWLPALRVAIGVLWIVSGAIALWISDSAIDAATSGGPLPPDSARWLARAGGVFDVLLGVMCFVRWQRRTTLFAMLALLVLYTIVIGFAWPQHWLDPLGGLVKNIPLLALLGILLAVEERR